MGVHARVLARACARVLRRRRRTSLRTLETARPFPSCRTTGPRGEREGTRHAVHCSRNFFGNLGVHPAETEMATTPLLIITIFYLVSRPLSSPLNHVTDESITQR